MNRASLDRGFGRCIVLRKYGTSLKKYANRTQVRGAGLRKGKLLSAARRRPCLLRTRLPLSVRVAGVWRSPRCQRQLERKQQHVLSWAQQLAHKQQRSSYWTHDCWRAGPHRAARGSGSGQPCAAARQVSVARPRRHRSSRGGSHTRWAAGCHQEQCGQQGRPGAGADLALVSGAPVVLQCLRCVAFASFCTASTGCCTWLGTACRAGCPPRCPPRNPTAVPAGSWQARYW